MLKNYNPVIVFAFSKRECEALALAMSKFEFNSNDEQELVASIFQNAIENLSPDDRNLPQISNLLPLLKRGIGIHHGGLLPILKEVIEILFQEGLIKVLFATETFSIGLNMPAKTVVFTAARKFDGREFRDLSSGEYIQMSGRAGRRGLDDRGVVIMMCDEKLEPASAKTMIKGEADRLDSAFHLGYNMILNLLKVEGISPEYMLERCFFQFQSSAGIPVLEKGSSYKHWPVIVYFAHSNHLELRAEERRRDSTHIPDEHLVAAYYDYRQQLDQMGEDFRAVITHPTYSLPFLQAGRLVRVKHKDADFGWGVVINFQKRSKSKVGLHSPRYLVIRYPTHAFSDEVRIPDRRGPSTRAIYPRRSFELCIRGYPSQGEEHHHANTRWRSALPTRRQGHSTCRPSFVVDSRGDKSYSNIPTKRFATRSSSRYRLEECVGSAAQVPRGNNAARSNREHGDQRRKIPQPCQSEAQSARYHPSLLTLICHQKIDVMEKKMFSNPLHRDPRLPQLYTLYAQKQVAQTNIRALKKRISATHDVLQLEELKCRKRVLRRLGFTNSSDVAEMKGRVACEISTGDELLLTELIFNGAFNTLLPEQCASLLSCFVFTEKVGRRLLPVYK